MFLRLWRWLAGKLAGLKVSAILELGRIPESMPSEDAFGPMKHNLIMKALREHGHCRLQVSGSSMLPTLWPGDTVRIESLPFSQLNPGDLVGNIVLYDRDGRFFLHRLIGLRTNAPEGLPSEALFMTRGDAIPQDDLPVPASHLLGVLAGVRRGNEWAAVPRRISTGSRLIALLSRSSLFVRLLLRVRSRWNSAVGGEAVPEAPAA